MLTKIKANKNTKTDAHIILINAQLYLSR